MVISTFMKKTFKLYFFATALVILSAWMVMPDKKTDGGLMNPTGIREEFAFIKYDLNHIKLEGKKDRWDNLFGKFENLAFNGKGKISVVHIGGSHVQGGFLTDKMRENFTSMVYGARGERGFVFPFKLAKSNSPRSIDCEWTGNWNGCRNSVNKDECLWGMSGISATCYDSTASVTIKALTYDSAYYTFSKVKIYHQNSSNIQITPETNAQLLHIVENPAAGYTEFTFDQKLQELRFSIHRTDQEPSWFTFQGAYLGEEKNGITYHAIGVNGASTKSYLRCGLFDEQLNTLKPDLAIFGIGVNDANVPEGNFDADLYEARYDSLLANFIRVNPDVCFMFVTNNDTYYQKSHPNKNAIKVQEVMYKLAAKYDGAVYDLFEIMGGLGSIKQWQRAELAASDKIHLSKRGYELQADMMSAAFREAFGNYLDKK
jgi:lysophospholipase L1-like esterase